MDTSYKVAVFGSTGFVGSYIVDKLIGETFIPKVLIRKGSESKIPSGCEIIFGNIQDKSAVIKTMTGTDAVIYNIGIIRQFPKKRIIFNELHIHGVKNCIEVAQSIGVKRFILMSANGVKPNGTEYQRTKWQADEFLMQSELNWTIFRPSLIFGDPRGHGRPEFCTQIKKNMLSLPLPAPLFYKGIWPKDAGGFSMTPIHVENVAEFFVKALNMENTEGKVYNLGGSKTLSWKTIIHRIALASGKNTWKLPAPVHAVQIAASIFEKYEWFPVTRDQLTMLMEGNTVSENYFDEFHIFSKDFINDNLDFLS